MNIRSREQRVRRMADRQGYYVAKCRRRDPRAIGYGMYHLVDTGTNFIFASDHFDGYWELEDLEKMLATGESPLRKVPGRKRWEGFTWDDRASSGLSARDGRQSQSCRPVTLALSNISRRLLDQDA